MIAKDFIFHAKRPTCSVPTPKPRIDKGNDLAPIFYLALIMVSIVLLLNAI